jgi:protein-arginine kinase activator protein McsA
MKNKNEKLSYEVVVEARKLAWAGIRITEISKKLNVEYQALYKAIIGESWEHVKTPEPFKKEDIEIFVCRKCFKDFPIVEKVNGKICKTCYKEYRKKYTK